MKYIIFLLPLFIGFHSVQSEIVDREFRSKTGEVIKASVIEFGEDGDLLIKRTSDLQLFRVNLDIFTEDDQAFVKNNFPPNHDALPKFSKPLDSKKLSQFAASIDNKIKFRLKSYGQRIPKTVSDDVFLGEHTSRLLAESQTLKK